MLMNVMYWALWLLQEGGQPQPSDDTMVKVICGVGAVVLLGIVILRRKSKKKSQDEF
ncbi:MAG: hypothetical protein ACE15B_23600 [Bryobacteraceae bacterium]